MTIMQRQTLMWVRILFSEGSVCVGEGTTIGGLAYGAESPEGLKLAIDTYFTPLLIGADADPVPAVMARLHNAIRANRFAQCAVETALYDALGHRLGLPPSQLLDGRQRDRLPVSWTLACGVTGRVNEDAAQMTVERRQRFV